MESPFGTAFSATIFAAGTLTVRSLKIQSAKSVAVGSVADVVVSADAAYVVPHNPNQEMMHLKPVGRRFSYIQGAEVAVVRETPGLPWTIMKLLLLAGKSDRGSLLYPIPHELIVKILCFFTCMRVASVRTFSIHAQRGLQRYQVSDIGGGFLEVVGSRPSAVCRRSDIRFCSPTFKFAK